MRFRHRDGSIVHLAYCTNVHPAESLDGALDQLAHYAEPIRERLDADRLAYGSVSSLPLAWRTPWTPDQRQAAARHLAELVETMRALLGGPRALTRHVEVETYTWSVLPGDHGDLVDGIAAELAWTRAQLRALGLEEVSA